MLSSDNNPVTLCAVGDISLGDSPKMLGIGVRSATDNFMGENIFGKVRQALQADLVFGNLEGILSDIGFTAGSFENAQLRGQPYMARVLRSVGFNVLSVANNHMMQYGPQAFQETCELLLQAGIYVVGRKSNDGWHCEPLVVKIRGKRIGFLGYSASDDYGYEPLYALSSPELMLSDVRRLHLDVDVLIVSLHWGDEFVRSPSPICRTLGHSLIEEGANIILGHHPHVIQGVEQFKTGWICYSLGNFIADMVWNPLTVEGLLINVDLPVVISNSLQVNRIEIDSFFMPVNSPFSLMQLNEHIKADENDSNSEMKYRSLVKIREGENRKLGHMHLVKFFYKYSLLNYIKIWNNSIVSLFNSIVKCIFSSNGK